MNSDPTRKRIEHILVVLIALHSYAIAFILMFLPAWGLRFGGFPEAGTLFFARQGGIFHAVVATIYLLEYRRHGTVQMMLLAKCMGVLFLVSVALLQDVPIAVPLSAVADFLMAAVMFWAHRRATA